MYSNGGMLRRVIFIFLEYVVKGCPRSTSRHRWQQGRIELNGKTLRDALAEFSRYHPIEKISIPDRSLRNLPVGGEFLVDNFMDFLDSLEYTKQTIMSSRRALMVE